MTKFPFIREVAKPAEPVTGQSWVQVRSFRPWRLPVVLLFFGSVATLRDTLSTSRSVGRGTEAFIYALSAYEIIPALVASRHAYRVVFLPFQAFLAPSRRQRHFHGNTAECITTTLCKQSRGESASSFGNQDDKIGGMLPSLGVYRRLLSVARLTVCVYFLGNIERFNLTAPDESRILLEDTFQ